MSDLYDVIDNNTDEQRWIAIETLRKKHTLKDIASRCNITYGSLRVWLSNNSDKYQGSKPVHTPSQTPQNTGVNDGSSSLSIDTIIATNPDTYRDIPLQEIRRTRYGDLAPTGYISSLDHQEWLEYYGGEETYRWDLPYLRDLQAMLWEGNNELGLFPRFSGKTVTWAGLTPREIAEVQKPILTICSPKRTKTLFRAVEKFIIRNHRFRQDYGDIIRVDSGNIQANRTELIMILHPSFDYPYMDEVFKVASRESDIIGRHPHHIHLEDIIQQESESEDVQEKLKEWYLEVLSPMLSLEKKVNARITGTATRKGPEDFYSWLFTQGWQPIHYKAIEVISGELPSHTDVIFEEEENRYGEMIRKAKKVEPRGEYKYLNPHVDPQKLLMIAALRYTAFMSQYQNEPIASKGNYFKAHWWDENLVDPFDTSRFQKYNFVDTAFGKTSKADYNAIITCIIRDQRIYIIDIYLEKNLRFNELKSQIILKARSHKVTKTYLHVYGREVWILDEVRRAIPSVEKVVESTNKIERIDMLDTPFKLGEIRIFNSCAYLNTAKTQYLQYDQKKSTATKKDDFLDVLATAYEKLKYYLSHSDIRFISR